MNQPKMITQQPVMKTTIPIPENRTTPDKVETSIGTLDFFDGVPVGDTKDTLVDFVERGRAVEAFINLTPPRRCTHSGRVIAIWASPSATRS